MSELIKADSEYKEWITGISTDFKKSQIRAAMKINDEMLKFYWKLGKGISSMSEQFGYGSRFYKMVSDDLKTILPDVKSFSPTNLKYMRYFYEMYPNAINCPQVEDDLHEDENRPQVGDDFKIVFRIPWGLRKLIISLWSYIYFFPFIMVFRYGKIDRIEGYLIWGIICIFSV